VLVGVVFFMMANTHRICTSQNMAAKYLWKPPTASDSFGHGLGEPGLELRRYPYTHARRRAARTSMYPTS